MISLGANVLDYLIVTAFTPESHLELYYYILYYIAIADAVVAVGLVAIGLFVESGGITTADAKTTWGNVVTAVIVITVLYSLARAHSIMVLAIHVQPGKLDFMGLFTMMTMLYFVMRFTVVLAHGTGLHSRIESIVIKQLEEGFAVPSRSVLPAKLE